jgi:predicted CXXCH cytochrome family protein
MVKRTVDGGSTWTTQTALTTPVARNFRAVAFANTSNGIAVGDLGTATSTINYTSDGGATWRQSTTTATVGLSGVCMTSASTGWAVGGAGVVLKTTNGGGTWVEQPSFTAAGLSAVAFSPDGQTGYIVGNAALPSWTAFSTTDGGVTWTAVTGLGATGAINLTAVSVLDTNNAVVAGTNGQIRRTVNGGTTWTNQSQNYLGALAIRDIKLIDQNNAKAIGDNGIVFYTRSAGTMWSTTIPGVNSQFRAVSFVDANNGWACGNNATIMRTTDAGRSWSTQASGITVWRSIHFVAPKQGWIVSNLGTIMHTSDGDNWSYQNSGTSVQLNGVWFTSPTTGYVVGNTATILKTTDGGQTWTQKPSGLPGDLNAVWFANANVGYAVGAFGRIRKTVDGGETWNTSISGTGQNLSAVRGIDASTVIAAGNNGAIVKTTDGGATWNTQTSGITQTINTVFLADANTGWFGSTNGIVKKTTNGGATWTSQNAALPTLLTDPSVGVYAMWFSDANTGYLSGDSGMVRRTVDGGAEWDSVQYGTLDSLQDVTFTDTQNGWAVGRSGTVLHTSDGGQSWSMLKPGTTSGLYGLWMTNPLVGWICGDNGTLRRTADGGRTWTVQSADTTANLKTISSSDATHAILSGSGVLKYTTNAGSTWTTASVTTTGSMSTTQPIGSVYMTDSLNAWAVSTRLAGNNVVWHTGDGGANWTSQATTANANLWVVYFRNSSTGYAAGDSGVILKTTNGGATWVRKPTPTTLQYVAIGFSDALHGWVIGGAGSILRTSDGGETWALQPSGTARALTGISFADTNRGWIVGANATLLRSFDLFGPSTTLTSSVGPPDGNNGWYRTTPQLTLTSSEVGGSTHYSWTSLAGPYLPYSAPFSALQGTNTLHYYSVDALGNSETPTSTVLRVDTALPMSPSTVATTSVSTSTAQIAWNNGTDAPSGVAYYNVIVDGSSVMTTTANAATVIGLAPATLHNVAIETVDVAGNRSNPNTSVSFFTNTLTLTPLTTLLAISPPTPNGTAPWYVTTPSIVMTSSPLGEPSNIYYSWGSGGPWVLYSAGTTLTASEGTSTLYYSSHDALGVRFDEPTKTVAFSVDTSTPMSPSVNASATDYQSIRLSWPAVPNPPSLIASYEVYLDGAHYSSTTSTGVEVVGLSPLTSYSFSVVAVSSAGSTSAPSAVATTSTLAAPLPSAPATVFAKAPSGSYAYVNWEPSRDTVGGVAYRIWRSLDGVTYSALATNTGGVTDTTYIDNGLTSSTRYWYAISTVDSRGESSRSSTASAVWPSIAPTTGPPPRPEGLTMIGSNLTVALQWLASPNPGVKGYYVYRAPASLSTSETTLNAGIPTTGTAFFDFTAVNGEPYYYSIRAVDGSNTIGSPSVEIEGRAIRPLQGGEAQPHAFGNDSACICHAPHRATDDPLMGIPGSNRDTVCETCHAPAASLGEFLDPLAKSRHSLAATTSVDNPFSCITCHVPLYYFDGQPKNLLRVNSGTSPCVLVTNTPEGNGFCYSCHGVGSTLPQGDLTGFEVSGHNNVPAPPTGAGVTCDACHESHSSRNEHLNRYSGFMMCMQCHTSSASDPREPDIWSKLQLNEDANAKHPLLPGDQTTGARMMCQNCHNTHMTTAANPLVDPHNPSPTGIWTTPRTDEKAFCFRCHDGKPLPTSAETTSWAAPVLAESAATTVTDIQGAYSLNVHGFGTASGPTTTTAYLRPDMGYTYNTVLECRSCHDPHGTMNNYALQQNVVSASGNKTVSGVVVAKVPGGGYDLRFFCSTCHLFDSATHDLSSMANTSTTTFPMDCTACHRHVRTNGLPSTRL